MPLQIQSRQVGKITILKCAGRIVAGPESQSLLQHVQRLIPSERYIVLHLGDIEFVDSSGVGTLVRLLTSINNAHGALKLSNVPHTIAHTLKITRLCAILEAYPSDEDAIASLYEGSATREMLRGGIPVVCVDRSSDVLAYLRELLRQAGFDPLTTNNLSDARILIKATKPAVVIMGSEIGTGDSGDGLRQASVSIPLLELEQGFSTAEAGESAQKLLEHLRAHTAKAN
jgi:anti-sigma B factor antagonist